MADQAHYNVRVSASYTKTIGITQRATPLSTVWTGELRTRFTDFLVNEIGEDGSVIHLRTVGLGEQEKPAPEVKPESAAEATNEQTAEQSNGQDSSKTKQSGEKQASANGAGKDAPAKAEPEREVSAEDVAALEALVGQKFTQELLALYKAGPGADHEKKKSITSEPVDDRPKRGQIHQQIRRIFQSQIETNTDDSGAILASFVPQRKGNNKRKSRGNRENREKRDEKPAGEYLHFTLFKENRDTMDAVNQIARFLKVKPQVIGYAGTKDRRASTTQRCSVRYTRSRNLAGINGRLWGVSTGDYEYKEKPIHLGELLGNEFVIAIKDCQEVGESNEVPISQRLEKLHTNVESAINHMYEHGWINYFGHQRFGTHHIGTHQIGKLILGEKYEEAVRSILHYDEDIAAKAESEEAPDESSKRDEYARNQACMLFLTGQDVDKAQRILPRRFSAETSIFRHLDRMGSKSRNDFVGALVHITRGLRSMYLHAYQSHVWNNAASKRWELHGKKVIKGDLVIVETEATPLVGGQDQDGDDIINPILDDDDDAPVRARPLTEEEAASGKYTIYDVVLPTPGYEVVLPDNEIGAFYEEFMGREENGALDPHKMRRMRREFSLPGRYRKLMNRFLAKPSVEVKAYADDTEQMHPTDLDIIKAASKKGAKRSRENVENAPESKKAKVEEDSSADAPADVEMKDVEETPSKESAAPEVAEAKKIAVVVKFQLGSSAYATVALRELMGDPPEEPSS